MSGMRSAATAVIAIMSTVAGCGGNSSASTQQTAPTSQSAVALATSSSAPPVVPGIPDPCALLPIAKVLTLAEIYTDVKYGPVTASAGGRACGYNGGRPDAVTISLTPVSKAGFDAFRQLAPGTVTDLSGGQEAYRSSQTPGVVDVFKDGFDLNVWVIHASSDSQAVTDAKALAEELAPKI